MSADQSPDRHENTVVFLVAPGDTLDDRWKIEARIGQGAMGSVFRGRDLELQRPVAIKILAPEHCRKPKVLARFEREAKIMTTLRHPNIIQLFGMGRRGALPYIVMQLLEGMTLADVLKHKGGKLTPGETMAVVKQISAGLSFVHHHKLVHRDIKPQNIFMSPGGRLTILDLGVIRDKSNPGLTKPGAMVGTPYYMSPEQITGADEIDKRTDVYALGAMTFELLVGRPPFQGSSNFEVLYAHKNSPPPDASQLSKSVSRDAAKALQRAMAKRPEERPQSASEFYADLEAFFGSDEVVDPAKAFAFLEEEAKKSRKVVKTNPKGQPLPGKKSTQMPTMPQLEAVKSPALTGGDVPYAQSIDVEMITSSEVATGLTEIEPATDPGRNPHHQARGTREETHTNVKQKASSATEASAPPPTEDAEKTMTESGELRVVTMVKGLTSSATLFIDDKKIGVTPKSVQMPAGRHQVRVERQGFKAQTKEVVVPANKVTLLRFEFQAK